MKKLNEIIQGNFHNPDFSMDDIVLNQWMNGHMKRM